MITIFIPSVADNSITAVRAIFIDRWRKRFATVEVTWSDSEIEISLRRKRESRGLRITWMDVRGQRSTRDLSICSRKLHMQILIECARTRKLLKRASYVLLTFVTIARSTRRFRKSASQCVIKTCK